MHVLVATDGQLDPTLAADYASRLAGPGGEVSVLTVIEVPRRLLAELRSAFGERPGVQVDSDAEYVGVGAPGGPPMGWPGDDAMLARYLDDKRDQYVGPVIAELSDAGVTATALVRESEDAASMILATAKEVGVDAIVIGSHGQGLWEGLLGSTGTKIIRRGACAVLVVRAGPC